jgi:hypothetical protein
MPKTVVGLYKHLADAHRAVDELIEAGFEREAISLALADREGKHAEVVAAQNEEDRGEGIADGAMIGGALGGIAGLLFGLAAFTIPGVGPLVVAGPLYTAVMGAGIGGLGGGLLAALTGIGVPEAEAAYYAEGLRRGFALLAVAAANNGIREAANIMGRHHPVDIKTAAERWRKEGWEGPGQLPDSFEPATSDSAAKHRYATGAMGSDLFGQDARRDDPINSPADGSSDE